MIKETVYKCRWTIWLFLLFGGLSFFFAGILYSIPVFGIFTSLIGIAMIGLSIFWAKYEIYLNAQAEVADSSDK